MIAKIVLNGLKNFFHSLVSSRILPKRWSESSPENQTIPKKSATTERTYSVISFSYTSRPSSCVIVFHHLQNQTFRLLLNLAIFGYWASLPLKIGILAFCASILLIAKKNSHIANYKCSPLLQLKSFNLITLTWWRSLSYKNQSINLLCTGFYMIGTSIMKRLIFSLYSLQF